MTKKTFLILLVVLLFVGAAASVLFLFPFQPNEPPRADDTNSAQPGINKVVQANNKFAFDIYSELTAQESGNVFYSPYSISAALAMTYEGAQGKTADEMKAVLHFPKKDILRPNFAAIYNGLNQGAKEYELNTGNALWVQQDFPLLADYTNRVQQYYGGKATNLDFINEAEQSSQTINSFIEEQTNKKITNLIPAGSLNERTRLVLTNAIYFKGTWQWEFDLSDTYEENFNITPTNPVKTPMMHMSPDETFNYAETDDAQILELPYKGEKISMLVLLPKKNLVALEPDLTADKLNTYKSKMQETKLDAIALPTFEFDTKYFMNDTLSALGMPTAFSEDADFSGMTGKKDLFISSVIHQAYVKVDEKGTEAAAATAITMTTTSEAPRNLFIADHPFLFVIQERETGNILFLGRAFDPTK